MGDCENFYIYLIRSQYCTVKSQMLSCGGEAGGWRKKFWKPKCHFDHFWMLRADYFDRRIFPEGFEIELVSAHYFHQPLTNEVKRHAGHTAPVQKSHFIGKHRVDLENRHADVEKTHPDLEKMSGISPWETFLKSFAFGTRSWNVKRLLFDPKVSIDIMSSCSRDS